MDERLETTADRTAQYYEKLLYFTMPLQPGSHLCGKHNTSDISISIITRKKEHVLFSCDYVDMR